MDRFDEDKEFLVKTLKNLVNAYASYLADQHPGHNEDRLIEELLRQLCDKFHYVRK